jgi:hypothetical protein
MTQTEQIHERSALTRVAMFRMASANGSTVG